MRNLATSGIVHKYSFLFLFVAFLSTTPFAREIHIVYANEYQPFSWLDENKQPRGISVDFLEEIFHKRMGLSTRHEVLPWKRAQLDVESQAADVFISIPTEARRKYAEVSALPLFSSKFIIFTGVTNPNIAEIRSIHSVDELISKDHLVNIMIIGGGWHGSHLSKAKHLIQVPHAPKILEMLKLNRADVYVEQEAIMRYQARYLQLESDILAIDNVLDITQWHIHVGKGSPFVEKMPEVNALLQKMEKDGSLKNLQRQIFEKYGVR
jgi:ABC-type amino acid transport substrate-binding protein